MRGQVIPAKIKEYFWDVDFDHNEESFQPQFIIERVLEFGDLKALRWLLHAYSKSEILSTLKISRRISPRTGNFYALYFDFPSQKLLCMRKPFTQRQNRF